MSAEGWDGAATSNPSTPGGACMSAKDLRRGSMSRVGVKQGMRQEQPPRVVKERRQSDHNSDDEATAMTTMTMMKTTTTMTTRAVERQSTAGRADDKGG